MVLIGFLYKTAQKPLKNRSNLAWKTVQKSPQEISGFWAVFKERFERFERFFQKKPPEPLKSLKSCWKTAQTAPILSGFWAGSRPGTWSRKKYTTQRHNPLHKATVLRNQIKFKRSVSAVRLIVHGLFLENDEWSTVCYWRQTSVGQFGFCNQSECWTVCLINQTKGWRGCFRSQWKGWRVCFRNMTKCWRSCCLLQITSDVETRFKFELQH